jgi:hypothetical protein
MKEDAPPDLASNDYFTDTMEVSGSPLDPATPVIFLDVDGVLHPLGPNYLPLRASPEELSARADEELAEVTTKDAAPSITRVVAGEFLPECMEHLKTIVDACGASIVLSTTWRETEAGRGAVKQQLEKAGIHDAVIGRTPRFGGSSRHREIEQWADLNGITKYVALDDMELELNEAHFVRTEMGTGLTSADAANAIKLLSS